MTNIASIKILLEDDCGISKDQISLDHDEESIIITIHKKEEKKRSFISEENLFTSLYTLKDVEVKKIPDTSSIARYEVISKDKIIDVILMKNRIIVVYTKPLTSLDMNTMMLFEVVSNKVTSIINSMAGVVSCKSQSEDYNNYSGTSYWPSYKEE